MKGMQETSPGLTAAILPSVPKHVAQAFSLLQGSPEAQVQIRIVEVFP